MKKINRIEFKEMLSGYLFLFPTLFGISLFVLIPVIGAFLISFTHWDLLTPAKYTGYENYKNLMQDKIFWKVLFNTIYYTVATVPLTLIFSLLLALAMNQKIRGLTLFRTIYFIPVVSSTVAVSLVWQWLYNVDYGIINYFLRLFHLPTCGWLSDTRWAMPAIILMSVWKNLGYYMVIFLAGLQGIPSEYYEAAKIDGASKIRQFFHITLPLLSPTTFFILIMLIISSFQVFDQIYIMTVGPGGPAFSTSVIILYIYRKAFDPEHLMGYASAMAFVLFGIIFILTILQFRFSKRWVHY